MANFSLKSIDKWYRNLIPNPKYRWCVIGATLIYLLSPIGVIPDIFPIVILLTLLAIEIVNWRRDRAKNIK
jgi:uncharacterized membrane protein YkvA (DUF1232 family)